MNATTSGIMAALDPSRVTPQRVKVGTMRTRGRPHRGRTFLALVLSAVLGIPLLFGLYTAFDLFGLVGGLGFVIVLGLIVSVAWIVHLARTFAPEIGAFFRSLGAGIAEGFAAQASLVSLGRRLAPVGRSVRRRLDTSTRQGLFLTIGVIITGLLASWFGSLTAQVLHHGVITQIDVRVASLSDSLHNAGPVRASTFFTELGGAGVRIPLSILIFGVLWFRRPGLRPFIGLVAVLVLGPAISDLVRIIVRRPRPWVGALALPGSYSFPSGHAAGAAAAFGYLAYLGIRATRTLRAQVVIALLAATLIIGVAYSRVVLGFHWTSDVVAGTVLGLAVAAATATWVGLAQWRRRDTHRWSVMWQGAAIALAVGLGALTLVRAVRDPQYAPALRPLPITRLAEASVGPETMARLPLRSETVTGRAMEPATLVFLGTRAQVEAAFAAAGWSEAGPLNIHTVLRLYSAGIHHTADPTAPVTPAFLAGRPQDMAFELAVDAGSVSKRHHTRVWASGFALSDGTPIWVATASLDDRVEIKFPVPIPNHHIAPAIDTERDFIARSLAATGLVKAETRIQAVPPEFGTNAAGDPFFTYGIAVVIDLR